MTKGERINYGKLTSPLPIPDLLDVQRESFAKFLQKNVPLKKRKKIGLQAVLEEFFPIEDQQGRCELRFVSYEIDSPKYNPEECIRKGKTYSAPMKLKLQIAIKDKKNESIEEIREQDVFLCDLPMITQKASFIINGVERVIVSQLHRSPGVFFNVEYHHSGKMLIVAQIIPQKGTWIDINLDHNEILNISLDRRRHFPLTIWLQAVGLGDPGQILVRFFGSEKVKIPGFSGKQAEKLIGRISAEDIQDPNSGEIVLYSGSELTSGSLDMLSLFGKKEIELVKSENAAALEVLKKTFAKVKKRLTKEEAAEYIFKFQRGTDPVNPEAASEYIDSMYFSSKRYNLGAVGRKMMKDKLGKTPGEETLSLCPEDFIHIMEYLFGLLEKDKNLDVDDIDHLGNRQVRRVGELLADQFNSAMLRVVKGVKDRFMLESDPKKIVPQMLINSRYVTNTLMSFFGLSQLSQFMEQTNPLAEMTHKRRLSALGPDGLTRDTAGFEVRDVHHSHYGRLCPIETPEGPNIGLITSLAIYSKINEYGFIETPYRKVEKGKLTDIIEYMSPHTEDKQIIAQANEPFDHQGKLVNQEQITRYMDDYPVVSKDQVDYIDSHPTQLLSISAALIPFMEHDEANRALMGSNMQRQAVPLVRPEAPLVGTGLEKTVARDSQTVLTAKRKGEVLFVNSEEIRIQPDKGSLLVFGEKDLDIYKLQKYKMTNQNTSVNQRPIVSVGDKVKDGQVIADSSSSEGGELALGKNVLVALMSWRGYNYEDAIIISERLIKDDVFTSVTINKFNIEVRETKLGPEEITREVPNVGEDSTRNLDENGIIRVGAEVGPDDILVGKVTPKGETELTPQEKLLKAIFGEKAADVRDTSLRVPPGVQGVVIDVHVLSRKSQSANEKKLNEKKIKEIEDRFNKKIEEHKKQRFEKLIQLFEGTIMPDNVFDDGGSVLIPKDKKMTLKMIRDIDWDEISLPDNAKGDLLTLSKILTESSKIIKEYERLKNNEVEVLRQGDDLPHGLLKRIDVFIAEKRKLSVGDKMSGRHGNKGVVSIIVPEEDMPYMEDGTPIDVILNPLGVPSRMNIGQVLETHLGWAAKKLNIKIATPVFDGISVKEIEKLLEKADLPRSGKVHLFDGITGQSIDGEITVGYMYMLKLGHMVDDKIHARSIGPYSMITQQPLGGKAHFGGQRFGEMEVWALEAYGAAYTLQEMLTVKSDDISGRTKMYESIIKGENPPEPGLPASFNVLVKELNGLCMNVEIEKGRSKSKQGKK